MGGGLQICIALACGSSGQGDLSSGYEILKTNIRVTVSCGVIIVFNAFSQDQ